MDSGIFTLKTFTEHRHDNSQNVTRILERYIFFMMYIGLIFGPDMEYVNKIQDMRKRCPYSTENPKIDIYGFWVFSP